MIPATPVLLSSKAKEVLYAKDQPQYIPLPSVRSSDGYMITSRWRLSWCDRLRVLLFGSMWLHVLTYGGAPQPIKLVCAEPSLGDCGVSE